MQLWGALKDKKVLPAVRGAGVPRQRRRDVRRARARVPLGVGEDQEPRDARVRREALQGLPRGVPRRRGLRARPSTSTPSCCGARADEREEPAPADRGVGERGASRSPTSSSTARSSPKLMKESAYAAVLGWKNALNVDPRVKQQRRPRGPRRTTPRRRAAADPGARAEDARGVRHLHQLHQGPQGRRARRDEVPQGEHLPPLQPLRRGDPDVPRHPRAPPASTRPRSSRPTCCSTSTTASRSTKTMLALVDKLDGDPKFLEGKDDLKEVLAKLKVAVGAQGGRGRSRSEARTTRTSASYVACGQALPRHLQPQPRGRRQRRGALQRRRVLRGGQVDRRRDPRVQPAARSTTRTPSRPRARSRGSARRTATSRSTTGRRTSSRSTPRSTPARRTRTTR